MRAVVAVCALSLSCLAPVAVGATVPREEPSASHPAIPYKPAEPATGGSLLWRTLLAFGVVLAVGVGAIYVLRRYVPSVSGYRAGAGQRVQVIEIRRLTPRMTLFLVEVEGERLLLAQSGDQIARVWQKRSGSALTPEGQDDGPGT